MGIWKKPPREVQDSGFEPGFGTFVQFRAHEIENHKPPPREELVRAFRTFFQYKLSTKRPINTSQAHVSRLVLENLLRDVSEEPALNLEDLEKALEATAIPLRGGRSESHISFAKALYEEIKSIQLQTEKQKRPKKQYGKPNHVTSHEELFSQALERFIGILTRYGAPHDAAEVLSKLQSEIRRDTTKVSNRLLDLHLLILRGYATTPYHSSMRSSQEQWEKRPAEYAAELLDAGYNYTSEFHAVMTDIYADRDKDENGSLRAWFERPIAGDRMARTDAYMSLLRFSSRTGCQPKWLNVAMQELCDSNPPKPWWDVVLKWALQQGKDIDHIKHMIKVISQLDQQGEPVRADTFTINGLLATAVETKNPLAAERINALASELGLRPSARTYALLLEARIMGKDYIGAGSVYEDMLYCGTVHFGSVVSKVANKYIRFLCQRKTTDSTDIAAAVGRLERQDGDLEHVTIMALCIRFLKDDKTMDVIDTLGLHLKLLSMHERGLVQRELVKYCLEGDISTARAWDCYSLLRQFFPEMSRGHRVRLMEGFFSRKRADMACLIFGHMRAHPDEQIRPDLDAYVACLEGLGAYPDADSLSMIHNMFKMDSMIQPNTRLLNAFMIAYTSCDGPQRAFDFWLQISNSADGPTYQSLEIVFRVCQKLPYGYDRAKPIWEKMQKLEVDVPLHVYDAYILMAAGQGKLEETKTMLLSRQASYNAGPHHLQ